MIKKLDLVGIGTSVLCTIHCIALPLFMSSLPVAGINLVENEWVDLCLIIIALFIGLISFYSGCFKKHKNKKPLMLFIIGFLFLLLNQFSESGLLTMMASLFIITAHSWNYRLNQQFNSRSLNISAP
jgi:cation transport ATPase